MPRPNVPLGIQTNDPSNYRNWHGGPDNEGIDLIGIIGRMLAGEDEQEVAPPAEALPMVEVDPSPVKIRPTPQTAEGSLDEPVATSFDDVGPGRGPQEIFGGPYTGIEELAPPLKPRFKPTSPVDGQVQGQAPSEAKRDVINHPMYVAEESRRKRGAPSQREQADAAAAETSPAPVNRAGPPRDDRQDAPSVTRLQNVNAVPGLYDQAFGGGSGDILGTLLGYPGAISMDPMGPGKRTGQDFLQQLIRNLIYSSTRSSRGG